MSEIVARKGVFAVSFKIEKEPTSLANSLERKLQKVITFFLKTANKYELLQSVIVEKTKNEMEFYGFLAEPFTTEVDEELQKFAKDLNLDYTPVK